MDIAWAYSRDSSGLECSHVFGGNTAHKIDSQRVLEMLITDCRRLVTDAEVFQEILDRYAAINRQDAIEHAFSALLGLVDQVFEIDLPVIQRAKQIVLGYQQLSARDAVHLSVMENNGIQEIFGFDSGFDVFPGIQRLF